MEGWFDSLSNALHLFTNAESVFGILIGVGLSAAAGFRVEVVELFNRLSASEVARYRLPTDQPLYVCHKPV